MTSISMLAAMLFNAPAHALLIIPTFDSTITGQTAPPNPASAATIETAINAAISTIDGLYSDPGTVNVLFRLDPGQGNGASTSSATDTLTYTSYRTALAADFASHPGNTVLATALANLPIGNTHDIRVADVLAQIVLGVGTITPCYNAAGNFVAGCHQAYDAVVNLGSGVNYVPPATPGTNAQAVTVIEHELDEVLGGGGTGTTLGSSPAVTSYGPTDLYRYAASGPDCTTVTTTQSHTETAGAVACYSIDGGHSTLLPLNNTGFGDFGDFLRIVGGTYHIQDFATNGSDVIPVYSAASPEYMMLLSIGYNAASVPEPAMLGFFSAALAGVGLLRRARPIRAAAAA